MLSLTQQRQVQERLTSTLGESIFHRMLDADRISHEEVDNLREERRYDYVVLFGTLPQMLYQDTGPWHPTIQAVEHALRRKMYAMEPVTKRWLAGRASSDACKRLLDLLLKHGYEHDPLRDQWVCAFRAVGEVDPTTTPVRDLNPWTSLLYTTKAAPDGTIVAIATSDTDSAGFSAATIKGLS